jgi:hypothetical protein
VTVYLPIPYPDELIYSVFARYFSHLGVEKTSPITRPIFGFQVHVNALMVNRLDLFQRQVAQVQPFDARSILERTTLFPYFSSALEPLAREGYAKAVLEGRSLASAQRLRALWPQSDRKAALHYCQACVSEDMDRLGETYWRRAHQLRVVLRCARHDMTLVPSSVPTRPYGLRAYWDATTFARHGSPEPATAVDGDRAALDLLARRAIERLDGPHQGSSSPSVPTCVAAGEGSSFSMPVGKVAVSGLVRRMQDFYGPAISTFLDASQPHDIERVISLYAWSAPHLKPPTVDLLIRTYSEACPTPSFASTGTPGSQPTRDEGEAGAASPARGRGSRKGRQETSRTCSTVEGRLSLCGIRRRKGQMPSPEHLSRMRQAWLAAVEEAQPPKITNARRREELLYRTLHKFDRAWMDDQKSSIHLEAGGPSYRGERARAKADDSALKRATQRDAWRAAVHAADHPKWSTAAEANPTLYGGLLEHDREWMHDLHSSIKKDEPRKQGAFGTLWKAADEDLLRRLEEILGMMREMGDARRLSRTKIKAVLSLPAEPETRVPLTLARIDDYLREASRSDARRLPGGH